METDPKPERFIPLPHVCHAGKVDTSGGRIGGGDVRLTEAQHLENLRRLKSVTVERDPLADIFQDEGGNG